MNEGAALGVRLNFPGPDEMDARGRLRAQVEQGAAVLARQQAGQPSSKYRGVTWDQTLGQYVAAWHTRKGSRAHKVDKRKVLGKFGADEEAAARAYDQAARADYRAAGGSAQKPQLNFPDTAAGELGLTNGSGRSRYRGVYAHTRKSVVKWKCAIRRTTAEGGKSVYLGLFDSEEAAARRYDQAVQEMRGATTRGGPFLLNFPPQPTQAGPSVPPRGKQAPRPGSGGSSSSSSSSSSTSAMKAACGGVRWHEWSQQWAASLCHGQTVTIGFFADEAAAIVACEEAAAKSLVHPELGVSELFGEDAFTALSYGRPYVVGMGHPCVEHDDQGEGKRTPAAETAAAKKAAPARRSKTVRSPAVPTPVAASGPEDVPTSVFSSVVAERAMRYRTFRMIGTDEPNLDGPPFDPLPVVAKPTGTSRGLGAFASRALQPGEFIGEYTGEIIEAGELARRDHSVYIFDLGDDLLVDALRLGNATRRMNHSEQPNVVAKIVNHHGVRKVCMYAAVVVGRGEELVVHYGPKKGAMLRQ